MAVREPDGYHGKVQETMWGTWPTFHSWNWPGHEGKPIDVEVYTRYPRVRLYQDGKLIGEKAADEMKATFTVDYAPGTLVAEGIEGDRVMETVTLKTAGEVADIRLTADRKEIAADGQDLAFVTIECVDKDGNVVPVADNALTVTAEGPVSLMALGNADIKDNDPYYDSTHHAWKGRALAVFRNSGTSGSAVITVTAAPTSGTNSITREISILSK